MEIRQLKSFLAVANCLSFSRAAEILCLSQSALSNQIKQLEEDLGTALFRRTPKGVMLTEAGQRLQPIATITCKDAESCIDIVRMMKEGISGNMRIGVTSTCKMLIQGPIKEMVRRYPRLNIQIECSNALDISQMLLHKQVDIAITLHPQRIPSQVASDSIFEDRLCLLCSKTHPLANRKSVTFKELIPYPIILPTPELYIRKDLERVCAQAGVTLQPCLEVSEPELMVDLVAHSQMGTMHAGIMALGRPDITAIPVADSYDKLIGCIHSMKEGIPKQSIQIFCELLKQEAAQLSVRQQLNR